MEKSEKIYKLIARGRSKAFELWNGQKMPIEQVHKALLSYLTEK